MTLIIDNKNLNPEIPYEIVYPGKAKYSFDDVCRRILSALEEHQWVFPGIEVKFNERRRPSKICRRIEMIAGNNFKIGFYRKEYSSRGKPLNNVSVGQINIPRKELRVYSDGSGPSLYEYSGKNWEIDRRKFISGNKENISYTKFSGCSFKMIRDNFDKDPDKNVREQTPYLASEDDLKSFYSSGPQPELRFYKPEEIYDEFADYLESHVLKKIENNEPLDP